jgi:phage-related baseplate assembly protein
MAGFTAVDLSRLPPPAVVEALSFEQILSEMLADLVARDPSFTAMVESDPAYKILEVAAFRELIIRQRVNDAAKAVMLASAVDTDLDNLGALLGVTRLMLDPGDPTHSIAPTYELDDDYRYRITLAPEGFSVAGPEGAYKYHALSADPGVLDASATSPTPDDIRAIVSDVLTANSADPTLVTAMDAALDAAAWPGDVIVTVLARAGDGTADAALLATVEAAVSADDIRPMTDNVTAQTAEIVNFAIAGTRYTFAGPDSAVVLAASDASLQQYLTDCHKLGRDITYSGLHAAITVPGIQRVDLTSPTDNLVIGRTQAPWCTGIALDYGGVDE